MLHEVGEVGDLHATKVSLVLVKIIFWILNLLKKFQNWTMVFVQDHTWRTQVLKVILQDLAVMIMVLLGYQNHQ